MLCLSIMDYLFGHLASMEIDKEFNIEFVGLNG